MRHALQYAYIVIPWIPILQMGFLSRVNMYEITFPEMIRLLAMTCMQTITITFLLLILVTMLYNKLLPDIEEDLL